MMRRRPPAERLAPLLLVGCLASAAFTACSGDDPAPLADTTTPSASADPEPEPVETKSTINRVDGKLDEQARERLQQRVTAAVDAWIDGAYGGTYPRDDFSGAFSSFTKRATSLAIADEGLMSNASVGPEVDEVRPAKRRVRIDVLAVKGTAVAVTARVDLAFDLIGEVTRRDKVYGSLYLTFDKSGGTAGWHVFGYDMNRKQA